MKTKENVANTIKRLSNKVVKFRQILTAVMLLCNYCVQAQAGQESEYIFIAVQQMEDSIHSHLLWKGEDPVETNLRLPFQIGYNPELVSQMPEFSLSNSNGWKVDPTTVEIDAQSHTISGEVFGPVEGLNVNDRVGGVSIVIIADVIRDEEIAARMRGMYSPSVSPNPVMSGQSLTIDIPDHWKGNLNLMDYNGRVLYKSDLLVGPAEMALDISLLVKGLYFLEMISSEGERSTKKILVE